MRIKKTPLTRAFVNGASKGRELEDNYIRFAHLSLHESELLIKIKALLSVM